MKSNELICYILDYLDCTLFRDVTIDELSLYFGYDKTYIMKKFKAECGISIKTYINRMKILNSLTSLKSDELLLKIALNNGFNSLEYYSEVFMRVMGVSPSTFRKYLNGYCSLDELQYIKESINIMNEFREYISEYRNNLNNSEAKILRLEIPSERKCA